MGKTMLDECAVFEEDIKTIADWDWESHLAEIARQSPDELEDLVKMYYKAEISLYKVRLAETLLLLNYREIIPDLIKNLNCDNDSNSDYEFFTSLTLIGFNEETGGKHLIKLHQQDQKNNNAYYLAGAVSEYKTDVAKKYYDIFNKLDIAKKKNLKTQKS